MKMWLCLLLACLLSVPALGETVQDQALGFIQAAGIGADSVMRVGDEVIVTLEKGGTACLRCPGDYDMYDLSWRFADAADEDVALYLDHALGLLAALEGKIPTASEKMAGTYRALVTRGLTAMEGLGQQGMRVLLAQMAEKDSALHSLRGRLVMGILLRELRE